MPISASLCGVALPFCPISLHMVTNRDMANDVAVKIREREPFRGVKEHFVEMMGFDLDFEGLEKVREKGEEFSGRSGRQWGHVPAAPAALRT